MSSQIIVPHSLRVGEYLTVILGFGLSTIAVCARVYTKLRITRKFLSEDYFSIAGYMGLLAYLGLAIVIGKNSVEEDPAAVQHKAFLSTVETIVYDPTIVLVKTSILLQYVTVFVAHRRNIFHYLVHALIWCNVIFYIAITFSYIFECSPRRKLWIPSTPGHCNDEHKRGVFSGSINVASDLLIFTLPLPLLLRLQMPLNKKLRLLFVFGFGLFACVASVVRLSYSIQLDPELDSTAYQIKLDREGLWAFAEISIGIIVGCMPLVHKSFKHVSSKISSSSSFNILGSSSGGSSWRRLFGGSATSEASASQKFFDSKDSGSVAPHIGTLNMTRASFSSTDGDLPSRVPQLEKDLPERPPSVLDRDTIWRRPVPRDIMQGEYIPEKIKDAESATRFARKAETSGQVMSSTDAAQLWEPHECTAGVRRNETRRARYDLYPRKESV